MTDRTGHCLCGAVSFTARDVSTEAGACHCEMCRRWTGSAFIGVDVPAADMTVSGVEHVRTFRSSDWGARSSCAVCGSPLWWRRVHEDADYEIAVGLFDDLSGIELTSENFCENRPDVVTYAGEREQMTGAEWFAKRGIDPDWEK